MISNKYVSYKQQEIGWWVYKFLIKFNNHDIPNPVEKRVSAQSLINFVSTIIDQRKAQTF